jgi:hypothetical protein
MSKFGRLNLQSHRESAGSDQNHSPAAVAAAEIGAGKEVAWLDGECAGSTRTSFGMSRRPLS